MHIIAPAPSVDTLAIFKQAADRSTEAHKAIGLALNYQPDYWSRVLAGERGITLDRLGKMPLDAQRAVVVAWAEVLGMRIERRDRAASQARRQKALMALASAALALAEDE